MDSGGPASNLTLRDLFALIVMPKMIDNHPNDFRAAAAYAYLVADNLIEERKK